MVSHKVPWSPSRPQSKLASHIRRCGLYLEWAWAQSRQHVSTPFVSNKLQRQDKLSPKLWFVCQKWWSFFPNTHTHTNTYTQHEVMKWYVVRFSEKSKEAFSSWSKNCLKEQGKKDDLGFLWLLGVGAGKNIFLYGLNFPPIPMWSLVALTCSYLKQGFSFPARDWGWVLAVRTSNLNH